MELMRKKVFHKKYGPGTITGFNGHVITVFFDQYGAHSFHFPEIFRSELRIDEDALQQQMKILLENPSSSSDSAPESF